MVKFTKLNPRYFISSPRDPNRIPGLLATDTITGLAEGVSVLSLAGGTIGALEVAVVDGSGNQITTFGSGTVTIAAGTAVIGKVGIDQTTPGTTNLVQVAKIDKFGTATAMTITLASLASSTVGVGRQSTLVTSNTAQSALITVKFTAGTTPTANSLIFVYLLRGDGTIQDDNAGSSDAGITVINAPLLGTILCSAATSNATYYGVFDTKFLGSLSTSFGVAIVNSTGATANATSGNFLVNYTLIT